MSLRFQHQPLLIGAVAMIVASSICGCVEPNYRMEVISNGQGGVDVKRVPKDPPPPTVAATAEPTPRDSSSAVLTPTGSTSSQSPFASSAGGVRPSNADIDARISILEKQKQQLDAEIQRLQVMKSQPATSP